MKKFLKKVLRHVPATIGTKLAFLPFRLRLGKAYSDFKKSSREKESQEQIFIKIRQLVRQCEKDIYFYKEFYKKFGFSSSQLKSFNDLTKIPIITKADLQAFDFESRVADFRKGIVTNTGGTTGQPLQLLLEEHAYAREWGHMHSIWEQLGYKTSSIKLTLRGENLGERPIQYNFIHNEFQINAYCDFSLIVESLEKVINKYRVEYLHGYPSAIYQFLIDLNSKNPTLLAQLRKGLKGVFFGSEYPAPIYRNAVEKLTGVDSISWYGHTEMAVLAREKQEQYLYFPFQSYGFAEAVEIEGRMHLVGTSYHNKIGPLIRYDTGDLIEPVSYKGGMLESFKVSQGRIGEFVIDKNNRRIPLTALIFGRHHKIFEVANFIQVSQEKPGDLVVIVSTNKSSIDCDSLFDSDGIEMNIKFRIVNKPFKTKSGKVPLIVKGLR